MERIVFDLSIPVNPKKGQTENPASNCGEELFCPAA
jgi:hypothetical protein